MKPLIIIFLLGLAAVAPGRRRSPFPRCPDARRGELTTSCPPRQLGAHAKQQEDPIKEPARQAAAARRQGRGWKPTSLLERSEFLSFHGMATLVPKGAVLNVPADLGRPRQGRWRGGSCAGLSSCGPTGAGSTPLEVSRAPGGGRRSADRGGSESIREESSVVIATFRRRADHRAAETGRRLAAETAAAEPRGKPAPTTPVK